MALKDQLNQPKKSMHGTPCSVGALLDELDGEELDALNAMLYTLGWDAGRIYDALRDEGYTVGRQSINRHRGGRCRCVKDAA